MGRAHGNALKHRYGSSDSSEQEGGRGTFLVRKITILTENISSFTRVTESCLVLPRTAAKLRAGLGVNHLPCA